MGTYQSYGTDRSLENDGTMVEFRDGVRMKIRSVNSKPARAAQDHINFRNRKFLRTGATIPAATQDQNEVELASAVVADWEGVTDRQGRPLACDEDAKKTLFTDLWELRQHVLGAAAQADTFRAAQDAADQEAEGN